jgi:hypothetical protein
VEWRGIPQPVEKAAEIPDVGDGVAIHGSYQVPPPQPRRVPGRRRAHANDDAPPESLVTP